MKAERKPTELLHYDGKVIPLKDVMSVSWNEKDYYPDVRLLTSEKFLGYDFYTMSSDDVTYPQNILRHQRPYVNHKLTTAIGGNILCVDSPEEGLNTKRWQTTVHYVGEDVIDILNAGTEHGEFDEVRAPEFYNHLTPQSIYGSMLAVLKQGGFLVAPKNAVLQLSSGECITVRKHMERKGQKVWASGNYIFVQKDAAHDYFG